MRGAGRPGMLLLISAPLQQRSCCSRLVRAYDVVRPEVTGALKLSVAEEKTHFYACPCVRAEHGSGVCSGNFVMSGYIVYNGARRACLSGLVMDVVWI